MEWRPVPRFPLYEVSDEGDIRNARTLKPLRRRLSVHGYYIVDLHTGKRYGLSDKVKQTTRTVHVLVCSAFHGPRPPDKECAHEDGIPTNVRADNLSWKTSAENKADMKRHGTVNRGTRNGGAKITEDQAKAILAAAGQHTDIAARFGVSRSIVGKIKRREKWAWLTA